MFACTLPMDSKIVITIRDLSYENVEHYIVRVMHSLHTIHIFDFF
jgi:hypothetical protein